MHAVKSEPVLALSEIKIPTNLESLVEAIGTCTEPYCMFDALMGVPRAYMEIPTGNDKMPWVVRGVYTTLGWQAHGSRADTEAALCKVMWDKFVWARDQQLAFTEPCLLFWRRVPQITEERDGRRKIKCITKISCRVWIPGVELATIEGLSEFPNVD